MDTSDRTPSVEIIINGVHGVWTAIPSGILNNIHCRPPKCPFTVSFPGTMINMKFTDSSKPHHKQEQVKAKKPYPPLFERFWSEYHPERRVGKRESFEAWKKLLPADRVCLPAAAAAYTSEAQLRNQDPGYMKHPVRFITSGIFEDYAEKVADRDALAGVDFWAMQFQATTGVPYPWKEADRRNLVLDVKDHGLDNWKDKVWFFFAGDNQKVKDAKEELGAHYNTFRSLLTGPLAYSGLKRKAACKHCGNTTGHSYDCPISVNRRTNERREREEIEAGKDEGLSILGDWNSRLSPNKENDDE